MKYEIQIEGGFTGIPKQFNGEIELTEREKKGLLHILEQDREPANDKLRDGRHYHLTLIDGEEVHTASFEETNLPLPLRRFIDTVSKKK